MVRSCGKQDRSPCSNSSFATAPSTNRQSLFPVKPVDLLVVRIEAFALKENAQPAIAEPAPFTGEVA